MLCIDVARSSEVVNYRDVDVSGNLAFANDRFGCSARASDRLLASLVNTSVNLSLDDAVAIGVVECLHLGHGEAREVLVGLCLELDTGLDLAPLQYHRVEAALLNQLEKHKCTAHLFVRELIVLVELDEDRPVRTENRNADILQSKMAYESDPKVLASVFACYTALLLVVVRVVIRYLGTFWPCQHEY